MAVSPAKRTSKRTTKTTASAKKTSTTKKATVATKKTTTRKRVTKPKISAEQRYKMTELAAYYIAEQNGFKGNPSDFWLAAEAQISSQLA